MSGVATKLELPNLRNTEDAIAFGRDMTPGQWLLCEGARQALDEEHTQALDNYVNGRRDPLQRAADLATKIQLLHEALEEAPSPTLLAVFKS